MGCLTLFFATLFPAAALAAPGSPALGGTFQNLGLGTRPLGMGGAFVAVADDANAAAENPAGMAFLEKEAHFATFTHTNLFSLSSLTRDYVAYAQSDSLGFGALGLSWNRFSATLDPETWTEDSFAYSGAKALTKGEGLRMAVGWQLKYMRVDSSFSQSADFTSVGGGTASGYGAGISLMIRPRPSLALAVAVHDLYSSLNWNSGTLEVLPTSARGGLAYRLTQQTLLAVEGRGSQTSSGFVPSSWHLGAEHWLFDGKQLMWEAVRNIGARAGYFQQLLNNDAGQFTAGATLMADQWQLDYAYQSGLSTGSLDATHRFGIGVKF